MACIEENGDETASAIYEEVKEIYYQILVEKVLVEPKFDLEFPRFTPRKRNKSPGFPRSRKERRNLRKTK